MMVEILKHARAPFIKPPEVKINMPRLVNSAKYRYRGRSDVDTTFASFDEWGEPTFHRRHQPQVTIWFQFFSVVKLTPKGAWIRTDEGERFVLNGAGKRFAHETPELALESLRARQQRRMGFLMRDLETVELTLYALAQRQKESDNEHR